MEASNLIENSLITQFSRTLYELAENERLTELSRQILAQDYHFVPLSVYQLILNINNNTNLNYVNNNLKLENFTIFIKEILGINLLYLDSKIKALFTIYAKDNKGVLTYDNFANIFTPKNNLQLKMLVVERIGNNINKKIKRTTIILMKKVIEREINLITELSKNIANMQIDNDFHLNFFNMIKDVSKSNDYQQSLGLTEQHINNLFVYSRIPYFDKEIIQAVMRRVDTDNDGIITFKEFDRLISVNYINDSNVKANEPQIKTINPVNASYTKGLKIRKSPFPDSSFSPYNNNISNISNNNIIIDNISNDITTKINIKEENNNTIDTLKKIIADYFSSVMESEDEIEKAKVNLTLRADFNINDTFYLFKQRNIDTISDEESQIKKEDIHIFLSKFHSNISQFTLKDIALIMKRCDLQNKEYLDKSDFFDMLVPFEKEYRNLVEKRLTNILNQKSKAISPGTLIYLLKLIEVIVKNERKINNIIFSLSSHRSELTKLFKEIINGGAKAENNIEYFTYDNLYNYFNKNNIYIYSQKQFKLLFIRLDRNRKGRIEFCDFLNELTYIL